MKIAKKIKIKASDFDCDHPNTMQFLFDIFNFMSDERIEDFINGVNNDAYKVIREFIYTNECVPNIINTLEEVIEEIEKSWKTMKDEDAANHIFIQLNELKTLLSMLMSLK
jgi:hypothetical protein